MLPDSAVALNDGAELVLLTPRDSVVPAVFWKDAAPYPRGYDAAIAPLDDASATRLGKAYFQNHPSRHAETLDEILSHPSGLVWLPGKSSPLEIRRVSHEEAVTLRSPSNHLYQAKDVLIFEITSASTTAPGDSGSMVVSSDAPLLLVGMHLGSRADHREILVARADTLFSAGVAFQDRLELAPP